MLQVHPLVVNSTSNEHRSLSTSKTSLPTSPYPEFLNPSKFKKQDPYTFPLPTETSGNEHPEPDWRPQTDADDTTTFVNSQQSRTPASNPEGQGRPIPPPLITQFRDHHPIVTVQSPELQTDIAELTSCVNSLTRELQHIQRSGMMPLIAAMPPLYNNTGETGTGISLPSYQS